MTFIQKLKQWFEKPVRFDYIGRYMQEGAEYLDVGCGDKAPYSTFKYYLSISYSGIDYHDIEGKSTMKFFFNCDLENNDLYEIPDNYYDIIILSHIIEHITNGEQLLRNLIRKLKTGGILYIETPNEISLRLPSWYGTLNFYDDPTHKRLYSQDELCTILRNNNCSIVTSRIRHNIKRIILFPFYALHSLFVSKKLNAVVLWDIVGFAHYVIGRKN
jgi:SAM-dependent methyltransferase